MKIEIRKLQSDDYDGEINALFVDDEPFDWGLDPQSLNTAARVSRKNPEMKRSIQGDIVKHFLACFSEFIGREITLEQVNQAIQKGHL